MKYITIQMQRRLFYHHSIYAVVVLGPESCKRGASAGAAVVGCATVWVVPLRASSLSQLIHTKQEKMEKARILREQRRREREEREVRNPIARYLCTQGKQLKVEIKDSWSPALAKISESR